MRTGNRRWQIEKYGQSAKNALCDHSPQRHPTQPSHPSASVNTLRPDRKNNGEQPGALRDHAMDMLIKNSTSERWNSIERSKGSRPIRNGKSGIVARDQRAKNDQPKHPESRKYGKSVVSPVVTKFRGIRNWLLSVPYKKCLVKGHGLSRAGKDQSSAALAAEVDPLRINAVVISPRPAHPPTRNWLFYQHL